MTVDYTESLGQRQLHGYIESIYSGKMITDTTDVIPPHEINIYLPDLKVGFEFNDVEWHSELLGKDRRYHLVKHDLCFDQDIRLIQIWENEWWNKQDIVKSRIQSLLQHGNRIFARKCTIQELTSKQSKAFFDSAHIQGGASAQVHLGLVHNDEVVAAMNFCKSRYDKNGGIELLRYANKINTNVIGGASKILNYYIKNHHPTKITSYADKRWSDGNLYKQLGFTYSGSSNANYFYFKGNSRLMSRIQFQKHKLVEKLARFDPELTEWQNMVIDGYNRIWDCGSSKWVLEL